MTTALDVMVPHGMPEKVLNGKGETVWLFKGRWHLRGVEAILTAGYSKWFTLDDLARLVYGCTNLTNREKVRKHIPAQRMHMLHVSFQPIITRYGIRGRIEAIKVCNRGDFAEKKLLDAELDRMVFRGEITEGNCEKLRAFLYLRAPQVEGE